MERLQRGDVLEVVFELKFSIAEQSAVYENAVDLEDSTMRGQCFSADFSTLCPRFTQKRRRECHYLYPIARYNVLAFFRSAERIFLRAVVVYTLL